MDAQELRNLQEAYMEVVENQQLDKEEKDKTGYGIDTYASKKYFGDKEKQEKLMRRMNRLKTKKEQVDIYDIILSHLLDEGYAETPEAAEVMMVNMSEEWRESIVEERKPLPVGKMDAKAKELKSKFLKSKPGSSEAKNLISRASQITGTRDKQTV
jgi:hypothetical protein